MGRLPATRIASPIVEVSFGGTYLVRTLRLDRDDGDRRHGQVVDPPSMQ